MTGTNPDAIEAWAFDAKTLEALLARLEPYRQVVLLSGDVHYSASTVMSYWTKGKADPARFVQFTSSGFKNVMPLVHRHDRPQPGAGAAARAREGRRRAPGLGPQAATSRSCWRRASTRGRHSARPARQAQARTDADADATAGPRAATVNPATAARLVVARRADLRPARRTPRAPKPRGRSTSTDASNVHSRRLQRAAHDRGLSADRGAPSAHAGDVAAIRARSCSAATSAWCASSAAAACCRRSTRCTRAVPKRRHRRAEAGAVRAATRAARRHPALYEAGSHVAADSEADEAARRDLAPICLSASTPPWPATARSRDADPHRVAGRFPRGCAA